MKSKSRFTVISVLVLLLLAMTTLVACGPAPAPTPTPAVKPAPAPAPAPKPAPAPAPAPTTPALKWDKVSMNSTVSGSVGYDHAQNYAQMVTKVTNGALKAVVVPGPSNVPTFLRGGTDMAIHTNPQNFYELRRGTGPFAKTGKNDGLRTMWPSALVYEPFIALASLKINTTAELKGSGLSIAGGTPGSGTDFTLKAFLKAAGLEEGKDVKVLRIGETGVLTAISEGRADIAFRSMSLPSSTIMELEATKPIKFIEQPIAITKKMNDLEYEGRELFAGVVINQKDFIKNFSKPQLEMLTFATMAFTRKETDPDLVYLLTKLFWENKASMEAVWAPMKGINKEQLPFINGPEWPLHDGAKRYYDEKGWKYTR